jgi:tRNA pseudouridine55 synthase
MLSGFLFIDKPLNLTSSQVVGIVKKQLKGLTNKVGHGGTLDPLATGVLPIALGEATKIVDYVLNANKTYDFSITFGSTTDSLDAEGIVIATTENIPTKDDILRALPKFIGKIMQKPPIFSAIKVDGKRAYDLARQNRDLDVENIIDIDIKFREIEIFELELLDFVSNIATLRAKVSKGTYIRTLAQDIALQVNSLGFVSYLRRVKIDTAIENKKEIVLISADLLYNIKECLNTALISLEDMLDDILAYNLNIKQVQLLLNGNISLLQVDNSLIKGVYKAMYNNKVIALLNFNNTWSIIRVFNYQFN